MARTGKGDVEREVEGKKEEMARREKEVKALRIRGFSKVEERVM